MRQTPQIQGTPKEILRAIRIFIIAIISGTIIFAGIVIIIRGTGSDTFSSLDPYFENVLRYVVIGIGAICLLAANVVFNKRLSAAKESLIPLTGKLNLYYQGLVIYVALCEGAALFSIISFLLTGNYYLFIVTVVMIFAIVARWPGKERVSADLDLDWQEQQELEMK